MVTISLDSIIGQRKLEKLKAGIRPDIITSAIGGRLMSYVGESFDTRGRGEWAALSPLTLLLRQRGGDVPLQDIGKYKQSFVQETDNATYVEVGTNIKTDTGISLGKIHEFGTGPYTIRVRRAKGLAAKTRSGQWLHFGKEVNHPGIPARPVLPTKEVGERLVREVVEGMLQKLADEVNRGGN